MLFRRDAAGETAKAAKKAADNVAEQAASKFPFAFWIYFDLMYRTR